MVKLVVKGIRYDKDWQCYKFEVNGIRFDKKLELNSISLTRELAFYRVLQTFLVIQYQGESFVMP